MRYERLKACWKKKDIVFFLSILLLAQTTCLGQEEENKKVYVQKGSYMPTELLDIFSDQLNCNFAYNPNRLSQKERVNIEKSGALSVQQLIDRLFLGTNTYLLRENQLIVFQPKSKKHAEVEKQVEVSGRILDDLTQKPIGYAQVSSADHPSRHTLSNSEGYFSLKVPFKEDNALIIHVSAIDYVPTQVNIAHTRRPIDITLKGDYISLEEVIILNVDPNNLLNKALQRSKENYFSAPFQSSAFFREITRKGKNLGSIAEAVFDLDKPGYHNHRRTIARLVKSRKFGGSNADTVQFKTKGSVMSCLLLDVIEKPPSFLDPSTLEQYDYSFSDVVWFEDEQVYIIDFKRKPENPGMPYQGKIYIGKPDYGINSINFEIDPQQIPLLTEQFIVKKTGKLRVKAKKATYHVSYRKINGKYFLSYVRFDLEFKVRKKNALFGELYTTQAEMVLSTIDQKNSRSPIEKKEAFLSNKIFFDHPIDYDEEYWQSYNHLELEKPLIEGLKTLDK